MYYDGLIYMFITGVQTSCNSIKSPFEIEEITD